MEKGLYRPYGGNESERVDYLLPIPLLVLDTLSQKNAETYTI